MRLMRVAVLALTCSGFCFSASKEMIELQRDVALLQDKVDKMQNDLDTKLGELSAMLQGMSQSTAQANTQLQQALDNGIGKQLQPVAGLATQVNGVSDDVRSLKDALVDLNARLERMDAKITDVKNQIQILQSPPPAPGATGAGASSGAPGQTQSGPPPGMSLEKTYGDARKDMQTGNTDLAVQEFQEVLQYYPQSELAANAQFYLGQIAYNKGDYQGAIQSFDAVLERYPQNPKTADAHLMKAMALQKSGQRTRAVQEYRSLIQQFPRTDDARQAQLHLRDLGATGATTTARRR